MSVVFVLNKDFAGKIAVKVSTSKRKTPKYRPPKFQVTGYEGPFFVSRVFKTRKPAEKLLETLRNGALVELSK